LLAVAATPAHAESTRTRQCVVTGTMTFAPPLTTEVRSGTIDYTYTPTCVVEQANGVLGTETYTNTLQLTYEGSCVSARVADPWAQVSVGALAGGTALVLANASLPDSGVGAGAYVLVASSFDPCAMSSASVLQITGNADRGSLP